MLIPTPLRRSKPLIQLSHSLLSPFWLIVVFLSIHLPGTSQSIDSLKKFSEKNLANFKDGTIGLAGKTASIQIRYNFLRLKTNSGELPVVRWGWGLE